MKYYKGIIKNVDEPRYGGEYVLRTGDAHEKYNFMPYDTQDGELCLGFFETKSTNGEFSNQLHIERIEGVSRRDEFAENVLVVWCPSIMTIELSLWDGTGTLPFTGIMKALM